MEILLLVWTSILNSETLGMDRRHQLPNFSNKVVNLVDQDYCLDHVGARNSYDFSINQFDSWIA